MREEEKSSGQGYRELSLVSFQREINALIPAAARGA